MNSVDMLWNINCSESTKYILVIVMIILASVSCMLLGKKDKSKQDKSTQDKKYTR